MIELFFIGIFVIIALLVPRLITKTIEWKRNLVRVVSFIIAPISDPSFAQ